MDNETLPFSSLFLILFWPTKLTAVINFVESHETHSLCGLQPSDSYMTGTDALADAADWLCILTTSIPPSNPSFTRHHFHSCQIGRNPFYCSYNIFTNSSLWHSSKTLSLTHCYCSSRSHTTPFMGDLCLLCII